MSSSRSWPQALGFSLIALFLWGMTALFVWSGLGNTWYGWVSQDWPVAEGRILESRVEVVRSTRRDSGVTTSNSKVRPQVIRYRPVIRYQWEAAGGVYERDRRNFSAAVADEETQEAAEAIIAPYEVGAPVEIHYDPNKPSRGILEPGPHWDGLSITMIAAVFIAIFATVFTVLAFRKLR